MLRFLRKYLTLWTAFFRMSWMEALEYRVDFILRIFIEVLWYVAQLSVFEVIYLHTNSIAGWEIQDVRIFMGTLFLVDCVWVMLFQQSFDLFSQAVRRGDLDLLLTKPVDAQFMISMRKPNPVCFFNFLIVIGYLIWAIRGLGRSLEPFAVVKYIVLMICGLLIFYSIRMLFAVLIILVHNAQNITYVWYQFYRLGTRPHSIYPSWLRFTITFVIPVGLIASVPAYHFLFPPDATLWISPLMALGLFIISRRAWLYSLRHYTSASS